MKKKIDPNVFILAAKRIIPLNEGCCLAIYYAGTEFNTAESALFEKMFKRWPLKFNKLHGADPRWWFGSRAIRKNQRLRRQCLLETALNLKVQGFVE